MKHNDKEALEAFMFMLTLLLVGVGIGYTVGWVSTKRDIVDKVHLESSIVDINSETHIRVIYGDQYYYKKPEEWSFVNSDFEHEGDWEIVGDMFRNSMKRIKKSKAKAAAYEASKPR